MRLADEAKTIKILLVEDEGIVARDVQRRLEQAGYEVCGIADSGDEAIALARSHRPDLALMDIVIQGDRDGIETALALRQLLDIPVVFLTAHSDQATVARARQSLPYGYLVKPFEPRELYTTIEMALYRHRAEARDRVYRKALDAAGVGIAIVDAQAAEHPLIWTNPAYQTMVGQGAAALSGVPCPLMASLSAPEEGAWFRRVLASDEAHGIGTFLVKAADGRAFHDRIVLSPVRDSAGRVTQLVAVHQDVSAEKANEQFLENAIQARTAELERARISLEQAQETAGIVSWNYEVETRVLHAPESLFRLFGVTPERMKVHPTAPWDTVVDEDREAWEQCNAAVLAGQEVKDFECRVSLRPGEIRWMSYSARPIFDEGGQLIRVVGILQEVTERKTLELRLQRSLDELRSLLDASPLGIVFSLNGIIRNCNSAYQQIMGREIDEIVGLPYSDSFLPRQPVDWGRIRAELAAMPERKLELQLEVQRKDGSWRWLRLLIASIDKHDINLGTVVMCEDITEQQALRQELDTRLEQLDSIFSTSPLGIAFFLGDRLVQCNEAYARLFGREGREMLGQSYAEWWNPPAPLPERADWVRQLTRPEREGRVVEDEIRLPDGRWRWIRSNSAILNPEADSESQHSVVINEDVTERRRTEELQQHLLAILDNSPDFIGMALPDGTIEFLNLAARQVLGVGEDYKQQRLNIQIAHPQDAMQRLQTTAIPEAAKNGLWSGESVLRHVNGFDIPVLQVVLAHRDAEGRVNRFSTVMHDLTERKRAEADLVLAKETAERASRAKSEFLSSMSHELRTPLNAILGFAQLLNQDPLEPLSELQKDSVDHIASAGWHLLKLINEVLDLAKIEAGKFDVQIQPVHVRSLTADVLHMLAPLADAAGIRLSSDIPDEEAFSVQADKTRLLQVVSNLVSNAIKYNRPQGEVVVSAQREKSYVRLNIRDTGPGLDAAQQLSLFQPFNRLGAEQSGIEGNGIGLVICKRLIEAMHGRIGVISGAGQGATFWVELPVAAMAAVGAADSGSDEERRMPELDEPLVLYVEDNAANQVLISRVLDRLSGIRLVCAARGAEGLALAHSHRPDLILLDINLPDMSGLDVARNLVADALTCDIPIVGLSANAMPHDIEAARSAGIHAYLTKPIDIRKLLDTVTHLLQERRKV